MDEAYVTHFGVNLLAAVSPGLRFAYPGLCNITPFGVTNA